MSSKRRISSSPKNDEPEDQSLDQLISTFRRVRIGGSPKKAIEMKNISNLEVFVPKKINRQYIVNSDHFSDIIKNRKSLENTFGKFLTEPITDKHNKISYLVTFLEDVEDFSFYNTKLNNYYNRFTNGVIYADVDSYCKIYQIIGEKKDYTFLQFYLDVKEKKLKMVNFADDHFEIDKLDISDEDINSGKYLCLICVNDFENIRVSSILFISRDSIKILTCTTEEYSDQISVQKTEKRIRGKYIGNNTDEANDIKIFYQDHNKFQKRRSDIELDIISDVDSIYNISLKISEVDQSYYFDIVDDLIIKENERFKILYIKNKYKIFDMQRNDIYYYKNDKYYDLNNILLDDSIGYLISKLLDIEYQFRET